MNKLLRLDTQLTNRLVQYRLLLEHPFIHYSLKTGNQTGFLFVLLYFYFLYHATLLQLIALVALIVAITAVLMLIKPAVKRQRPFPEYAPSTHYFDNFSFPSGHATRVGAILAFASFFFPLSIWLLLLSFWGFTIALSRVVRGAHYVSDVLGGIFIGYCVAIPILMILQFYL